MHREIQWTIFIHSYCHELWSNIFKIAFRTIRVTKFQTFQNKPIHRLIACQNKCLFCSEVDDLRQNFLFHVLPKTDQFWTSFFNSPLASCSCNIYVWRTCLAYILCTSRWWIMLNTVTFHWQIPVEHSATCPHRCVAEHKVKHSKQVSKLSAPHPTSLAEVCTLVAMEVILQHGSEVTYADLHSIAQYWKTKCLLNRLWWHQHKLFHTKDAWIN